MYVVIFKYVHYCIIKHHKLKCTNLYTNEDNFNTNIFFIVHAKYQGHMYRATEKCLVKIQKVGLPDPTVSLARKVPSSTIVQAN